MLDMQPLLSVSCCPCSLVDVAGIQQSRRKDRRDAYLPLRGHVQAPDFDNGEE